MSLQTQSASLLQCGVFEIDLRAGELRKQGVRIKLQEQPFLVLKILVARPGEIVSREELRSQIWSADRPIPSLTSTIASTRPSTSCARPWAIPPRIRDLLRRSRVVATVLWHQ
jgi:DNA-binding response OmpR family regulator